MDNQSAELRGNLQAAGSYPLKSKKRSKALGTVAGSYSGTSVVIPTVGHTGSRSNRRLHLGCPRKPAYVGSDKFSFHSLVAYDFERLLLRPFRR